MATRALTTPSPVPNAPTTIVRGTFDSAVELKTWLEAHGVSTATWGTGKAKRKAGPPPKRQQKGIAKRGAGAPPSPARKAPSPTVA